MVGALPTRFNDKPSQRGRGESGRPGWERRSHAGSVGREGSRAMATSASDWHRDRWSEEVPKDISRRPRCSRSGLVMAMIEQHPCRRGDLRVSLRTPALPGLARRSGRWRGGDPMAGASDRAAGDAAKALRLQAKLQGDDLAPRRGDGATEGAGRCECSTLGVARRSTGC